MGKLKPVGQTSLTRKYIYDSQACIKNISTIVFIRLSGYVLYSGLQKNMDSLVQHTQKSLSIFVLTQ